VTNKKSQEIVTEIKNESLLTLKSVLGQTSHVILVGFPSYTNPGDTMIWLGTLEYLRVLNVEILHQCDIGRFDQELIDNEFPGTPILMQGGGNFGDLWPHFQDFREKILSQNPDRLIIQLPQSVYFESQKRSAKSNDILSKHKNFIFLVRDSKSLHRAKELFPEVLCQFCPDMAFGLNLFEFKKTNKRKQVAILRQDRERLNSIEGRLSEFVITDWHLSYAHKFHWSCLRIILMLHKRLSITRIIIKRDTLEKVYHQMALINLKSALKIVKPASIVVTDRLHAHVLAILCGVPNVVCDNSYGKISSIYNDYSGGVANSRLCLDINNLNQNIDELLYNEI
jgi:exopolysaccharide biosynthesis predicted pyruvyltransferase EpsI